MKKYLLGLLMLWGVLGAHAQGVVTGARQEESRLFIRPFREVFVNFPARAIESSHTLSVFLPQEALPLPRQYPLVLFLNLPRTAQTAAQAEALARRAQVLVAAIDLDEDVWARNTPGADTFIRRELLPYLQTNYPLLPAANQYTLVARGAGAAQAALELLTHPGLFGSAVFFSPGEVSLPAQKLQTPLRLLVLGNQAELAGMQRQLERAGFSYGVDFALRYLTPKTHSLQAQQLAYLRAPAAQVEVKKLEAFAQRGEIPALPGTGVALRTVAWLQNGQWFDFIPAALRSSPPYLQWKPELGILEIRPGAEPGVIKVHPVVDKWVFGVKIKLKKQQK